MESNAQLKDAKPCPFCGSNWILIGERYYAICVDCGATGPERSKAKMLKDWNSRVEGKFTNNKDGSITNVKTMESFLGKITFDGKVVWEKKGD